VVEKPVEEVKIETMEEIDVMPIGETALKTRLSIIGDDEEEKSSD
jgi:hypothetical protein